jgi:hypothetical protein
MMFLSRDHLSFNNSTSLDLSHASAEVQAWINVSLQIPIPSPSPPSGKASHPVERFSWDRPTTVTSWIPRVGGPHTRSPQRPQIPAPADQTLTRTRPDDPRAHEVAHATRTHPISLSPELDRMTLAHTRSPTRRDAAPADPSLAPNRSDDPRVHEVAHATRPQPISLSPQTNPMTLAHTRSPTQRDAAPADQSLAPNRPDDPRAHEVAHATQHDPSRSVSRPNPTG